MFLYSLKVSSTGRLLAHYTFPLLTEAHNVHLELLEALRASLRAKSAALAEDNWMYEKEEELSII